MVGVGVLVAALWAAQAPALPWTDDVEVAPLLEPEADEIGRAGRIEMTKRPVMRTLAQTTFVIALQSMWYWRRPSSVEVDSGTSWDSWKAKLFSTDEITFDPDYFITNSALHPIQGAVYYQIARGNGLGFGWSFLASFIGSTVWEYTTEFVEPPSLNDLIITPAAGAVIGEAGYRLGRFFAAGRPGPVNCVGAVLFSPIATFNEADVCSSSSGRPPYGQLGFSRRAWHRFGAGLAVERSVFDRAVARDETRFTLAGTLVTNTGYRRPGSDVSLVVPGQWTSLAGSESIGNGRVVATSFHADTSLVGLYLRRYTDAGPTREPDGTGLMLGAGSTFDYDVRVLPMGRNRMASVGLAGPMLELATRHDWLALRASVAAQYAFAVVESLAFIEAQAYLPAESLKSPLRKEGYYYAHGVTSSADLKLELARVDLIAAARGGWFWSIDARDRRQDELLYDWSLGDRRLQLHAEVAIRMLGDSLRLALAFDHIDRTSSLARVTVTSTERRAGLEARFVF